MNRIGVSCSRFGLTEALIYGVALKRYAEQCLEWYAYAIIRNFNMRDEKNPQSTEMKKQLKINCIFDRFFFSGKFVYIGIFSARFLIKITNLPTLWT